MAADNPEIVNMFPPTAASIVIATADRPTMVLDCVRSMKGIVPDGVELIVVDSGSAPVDEVQLLSAWPNVRVLRFAVRNAAAQRNAGVRLSGREFVCFVDDDAYFMPGWWPAILAPFADASVGGVAGAVWSSASPELDPAPGFLVTASGRVEAGWNRSGGAWASSVDWAMGGNMAYRRLALEQIGGFSERIGFYDEEVDVGLRMRATGWRIQYVAAAAVHHYGHLLPRKRLTKKARFRMGRNRSLAIVGNARSALVMAFLACEPIRVLISAAGKIGHCVWHEVGHAATYVIGLGYGFVLAMGNRVSRAIGGMRSHE
jgi:GT2 family glycosyltransferase